MDTTVITIISITLLATLGLIYLAIRGQVKPRIKVSFPDGLTQISYRAKEEANVAIHIKNIGRLGFPKPVARGMIILVYTLPAFSLKEFRWIAGSSTYVRQASSGGIFGGMHYVGDNTDLILFHQEEEVITVVMQMPENTGKYPVKVAISSQEGDLGVHELTIIVS